MEISTIGWVICAAMVTVVVIAILLARLVFPRDLLGPPEPEAPEEKPLPPGVVDLKEGRNNHWR